ncbi:hypothetical protein R69746_06184 [Paraburkholderia aspalathi]|uniref:hypothetical protein n=1 Tax=Paraburkholderia aspalathi TaxID=1324617 RepID=UPI00190BD1E9|nr:hypothetical protein [Paraburkholderia aspalathi]MBK3844357.1 hypothetical protein [Paraburkholderia aspalathi]CAE6823928.1 hypothetical protein R69746_06184 [Paraburkholderia aspalathi]
MTNESTIRYELLTNAGLRAVAGEHVVIPNDVGATFGIHAERYLPGGHPEKWVVTHLASGVQAGTCTTRTAAIAQTATRLEHNRARLRELLNEATSARADFQRAAHQLERNRLAIIGRTRA